MADKINTNYKLIEPEVGASQDNWGEKLNDNWNKIDSLLHGDSYEDINLNTVSQIQPNLVGGAWEIDGTPVTSTASELNYLSGLNGSVQDNLDLKAPLASPALTGIPTAPTAATATDTTQIATTEFVKQVIAEMVYPVGSIYVNATSTENPATLLGFGTWVEHGSGRVLVGQNTGDSSFDTLGETGGQKDAVIVSHSHTGTTNTTGSHTHSSNASVLVNLSEGAYADGSSRALRNLSQIMNPAGDHSHTLTTDTVGESGTNKNLQPYVVVKMWKRTA
jgi:hypothetical protein